MILSNFKSANDIMAALRLTLVLLSITFMKVLGFYLLLELVRVMRGVSCKLVEKELPASQHSMFSNSMFSILICSPVCKCCSSMKLLTPCKIRHTNSIFMAELAKEFKVSEEYFFTNFCLVQQNYFFRVCHTKGSYSLTIAERKPSPESIIRKVSWLKKLSGCSK